MGMNKSQACPHHPDADPSVVPTTTMMQKGGFHIYGEGEDEHGNRVYAPCSYCWQRHAEWLAGELDPKPFPCPSCGYFTTGICTQCGWATEYQQMKAQVKTLWEALDTLVWICGDKWSKDADFQGAL